jgi:hypothetical protein
MGWCSKEYWDAPTCGMKDREQCKIHSSYKISEEDRADLERARVADSWFSLSLH